MDLATGLESDLWWNYSLNGTQNIGLSGSECAACRQNVVSTINVLFSLFLLIWSSGQKNNMIRSCLRVLKLLIWLMRGCGTFLLLRHICLNISAQVDGGQPGQPCQACADTKSGNFNYINTCILRWQHNIHVENPFYEKCTYIPNSSIIYYFKNGL